MPFVVFLLSTPRLRLWATLGSATMQNSSHPEWLSLFAARHSQQNGCSRKMTMCGYLFYQGSRRQPASTRRRCSVGPDLIFTIAVVIHVVYWFDLAGWRSWNLSVRHSNSYRTGLQYGCTPSLYGQTVYDANWLQSNDWHDILSTVSRNVMAAAACSPTPEFVEQKLSRTNISGA